MLTDHSQTIALYLYCSMYTCNKIWWLKSGEAEASPPSPAPTGLHNILNGNFMYAFTVAVEHSMLRVQEIYALENVVQND